MNILEKLNEAFTLEAQESSASKVAIQELKKFSSINIPSFHVASFRFTHHIKCTVI
ncbi:1,3-beta-glucan synthase regulator [Bacillus cereus]|nr:1,3-beta-glucan synthase regulator [Bacillus cereus]PGM58238.1 1,3-beta-glucan synthase regulator [Bacillus cereus]